MNESAIPERITCKRTSTEIVKNHDVIGIEDLHVSGMMKNKKFSKGISEASWAQFRDDAGI